MKISPDSAGHLRRAWRHRHPVRRRVGRRRHWIGWMSLTILAAVIGGSLELTSDSRVRRIAGDYLTDLLGAQVDIGAAQLSLFEGLRLDRVRISVPDGHGRQSTLLEAANVVIHYHVRDLLAGRLNATQIIVVDPHVRLEVDERTQHWNYELLKPWRESVHRRGPANWRGLPEVVLRNAQVDYLELSPGKATLAGSMALEGQFGSSAAGGYEFSFQSRGSQGLGPTADGRLDAPRGHLSATLRNLVFGTDIQAMLPGQVGQWCREHELAGRMNVTLDYTPADAGFRVESNLDGVELSFHPPSSSRPVIFHNASGTLIFTNGGIESRGMRAWIDNSGFSVNGIINGYSPDAPADLTISSTGDFAIASNPPWEALLPPAMNAIYERIRPTGRGAATVRLTRSTAGGPLKCQGTVDAHDGGFTFADIPYPVSHATGHIVIGPDGERGFDTVRLVNIHGHGIDGGPNEKADLTVNGWIGPFDPTCGGQMEIRGEGVHSEDRLWAALPPLAQTACRLLNLGRPDQTLIASFHARASRDHAGHLADVPWIVQTDLNVSGGQATYQGFPYALREVGGQLEIRDGYANVRDLEARHGSASVKIDGRIDIDEQGKGFSPDLHLTARNVPIDADVLAALPEEPRKWLRNLGASGQVDVAGRLRDGFDLVMTLRDGALSPRGQAAVSDVAAHIHLTPRRLDVIDLAGSRGDARLTAHGGLDWTDHHQSLSAHVENLTLDKPLYALLPPAVRRPWDSLRPAGAVDLQVTYDNRDPTGSTHVIIRPRQISASARLYPQAAPLSMDHVTGWASVTPGHWVEWNLTGRRGAGRIGATGSWNIADPTAPWDLKLSGRDINVDANLAKSMPTGLGQVIQGLKLSGKVGFEFSKLVCKGSDIDFIGKLDFDNTSLTAGVPMEQVNGSASLSGSIRQGRLKELSGDLSASSLLMAGRSASDLTAKISKPADQQTIQITGLKATVCGGDLAGDMAVSVAPRGGKYAVSLVLSGADVRELTGATDAKLTGQLTASLEMTGSISDENDRRGRGEVRVYGGQMYQIPLVLGLFQVTNLALPINSPFERASASYSVLGQKVALERILLGSKDVTMHGQGHIDFAANKVELTFDTDNPGWLAIPLVGPVWNKAQNELLRIHVKGSLRSPKISATSFDTVTTTVDEVLRGNSGE